MIFSDDIGICTRHMENAKPQQDSLFPSLSSPTACRWSVTVSARNNELHPAYREYFDSPRDLSLDGSSSAPKPLSAIYKQLRQSSVTASSTARRRASPSSVTLLDPSFRLPTLSHLPSQMKPKLVAVPPSYKNKTTAAAPPANQRSDFFRRSATSAAAASTGAGGVGVGVGVGGGPGAGAPRAYTGDTTRLLASLTLREQQRRQAELDSAREENWDSRHQLTYDTNAY